MIWHKTIVNPPNNVVSGIQRNVIHCFWSGYHWTKAAVLFLPVNEGGHGLMDIQSRIMTFRIQAVQRRLYSGQSMWTDTACSLLQKVDIFKYDKPLFLIRLMDIDLSGTSCYYKSVLKTWRTIFKVERSSSDRIQHELINNTLIEVELSLRSLRFVMAKAGCTKVSKLRDGNKRKSPFFFFNLLH